MAELNLSTEIINNILKVLNEYDSSTSDQLVASQYMAAIIGFLVSKENLSVEQKEDVINELSSFIRYVVDDLSSSKGTEENIKAQDSFGIWNPD